MSPRILTIAVEPPYFQMARVKTITSTRFEENWQTDRIVSKWYFLTERQKRVYLKFGWNLFGRRRSNNIRFRDRNMKSCELTIFIPEGDEESPSVHSINGHCIIDGIRMSKAPATLYHRTPVGIYMEATSKLVVMEFFNADVKEDQQYRMEFDE